jgi:hypothetical protein
MIIFSSLFYSQTNQIYSNKIRILADAKTFLTNVLINMHDRFLSNMHVLLVLSQLKPSTEQESSILTSPKKANGNKCCQQSLYAGKAASISFIFAIR